MRIGDQLGLLDAWNGVKDVYVIELARALDRLPVRLAGYGIEGAAFEIGTGLSPAVEAAVEAVTSRLLAKLKASV